MFLRAGFGTARSSAFLGVFVFIYQCGFPQPDEESSLVADPEHV